MNYQSKYRLNSRLIENYVAFLPECERLEDSIKLSAEITRLNAQNKQIEMMLTKDSKKQIKDYKIKEKSSL
tara:strand:+ start:95 stop:307 length:213 start_codon:yes stop_codon:yes gene_type:complete